MFSLRPGLLLFSSSEPGAHVTLFGPAGKLRFRDDHSSFNDKDRAYTWAFELHDPPQLGQHFIFADAERTIVGEVHINSEIKVVPRRVSIARSAADGKPLGVDSGPEEVVRVSVSAPYSTAPPFRPLYEPRVSILTCTYNRPDFLRGAIESLRRQSDPNWEHLIYDNGSTNPEVSAVLRWASRDPRVRVFRGDLNRDQPAAFWNQLADRMRSKCLTVLDDDNEKSPRFVEAMVGELDRNPEIDLVTCGTHVIRPDGELEGDFHLNLETKSSVLAEKSTCDGGAVLVRKEAFDRVGYFSEAIRTNEDWEWMRRAARLLRIKNLPECLTTYRSHGKNRMLRARALGHDADVERVRLRDGRDDALSIYLVHPDLGRLTQSQKDALGSIARGLGQIPWVRMAQSASEASLGLIALPFQIDPREVDRALGPCRRALSVHLEDPYALHANVERVRSAASGGREVWVSTNDASAAETYREIVGERVVVCPLLGVDEETAARTPRPGRRDIDVLLCGYAYPSRKRLVEAILPRLRNHRIVLVGDGWEGRGEVETMPTQGLAETYALHGRARAVVCLHRTGGDCSDGPVPPRTMNRGFMEGAFGPRVFVDESRAHHHLDEGDVVFYQEAGDLAGQLHTYLAGPRAHEADLFMDKCRALYSYRARLARALNCVRSPRFGAEIP